MTYRPITYSRSVGLLVGLASVAILVDRAFAHTDCEIYAKYTALQLRTNIDDRCKYEGPLWSGSVAEHRAWCKDVGFDQVRKVLGERQKLLAACRKATSND